MLHDNQGNIQPRETIMSNQMIYNGASIHVKWSEQTWQNQSHYAKQGKMINQHINVPNKYSNEAWEKSPQSESPIKIINHHNQHVHVPNEYNNQACIQWYQELSMCNQEIGIHWSTNPTPHLLHLKFKFDPLVIPSGVAILWTPHFGSCVSHSIASSIFIWKMIY